MTEKTSDIEELADKGAEVVRNFSEIADLSMQIWQAALAGQNESVSPAKAVEEFQKAL